MYRTKVTAHNETIPKQVNEKKVLAGDRKYVNQLQVLLNL